MSDYHNRCIQQLKEWVEGRFVHNTVEDECCPDFSCCQPDLLASEQERKLFYQAAVNDDRPTMDKMLMMFLRALLSSIGKNAYLAGESEVPEV